MATIAPFVTPQWLTEQLDNVVVLDVRYALDGSITKQDYLAGHIPTAIYANFPSLAGGDAAPDKGRSPLPDPAKFAADLGALGVGDDTTVIVYDQGGSGAASRIVYMLRSLGDNAAVLDGGLAAWNGPLDTSDVTPIKTTRNAKPWPTERFIDADELTHLMDTSNTVLFDARPEDRYAGLNETVDARPGHIPSAINLPVTAHLAGGITKDVATLKDEYAQYGTFEADNVISYCGSGVAACYNLLVLEQMGVKGRLYTGSWSQWSADPNRPGTVGNEPGTWTK
jgi:thiosulfate/3-mercaptopyruvate sulfurtransferase